MQILNDVNVRLLGSADGSIRPQQRLVLAALAVDAGRLVPWDVLVDRVWGEDPPARARQTLYTHIARIRKSAPVSRVAGGYLLDIDPDRVDLHLFSRLVERAGSTPVGSGHGGPDEPERADTLRRALELWRGEPLAGLPGDWAGRTREQWRQRHLEAVAAWAQAELDRNNPQPTLRPLTALVDEHPLVEPLVATLIRALHLVGRTAQALERYVAYRSRLADELGIDPGTEMLELHRLLVSEPAPAPPADRVFAEPATVPAQLPAAVTGFVGRHRPLARLDALADTRAGVAILIGMAGVGKTALAVHWGRESRARFPDGQLYLNLRGFETDQAVVQSSTALRILLETLGVPAQRIPVEPQSQVGLYRSLLANKRMLVLLDNVRDVEQVRLLLPGAPDCFVIITSRDQLTGLIAKIGAHPVPLEPLDQQEARDLLAVRLGERVAAQPEAVGRIVQRCARLPLALAIAAARAAVQPDLPLAALADDMYAETVLDSFAADPGTDLRATFSWSYRGLGAPAARMFRLLGAHVGPDISLALAASMAGVGLTDAQHLLRELTRAQLLMIACAPQRWVFHDLLKAYAAELLDDTERAYATVRLLDHCLYHALRAAARLEPNRKLITVAPVSPTPAGPAPASLDTAMSWMQAEHAVVEAAVARAERDGYDTHAWQLAWTLFTYHRRQGMVREWVDCQRTAVRAAARAGDPVGQANAHYQLAAAQFRYGCHDSAEQNVRQALRHYGDLADHYGLASSHYLVTNQREATGDFAGALEHADAVYRHYRLAGHLAGQGRALCAMGYYQARLGRYEAGLVQCRAALTLLREARDVTGEAFTWHSLGYIHQQREEPDAAVAAYGTAVAIHQELDDRNNLAPTLEHLGDAQLAAGDPVAAGVSWRRALDLLTGLGRADASGLGAKLDRLTGTAIHR